MGKEGENGLQLLEVQEIIELMPNGFDSHDFIRKFIWKCPEIYGRLLIKHANVTTAHAEISNYLRCHTSELGINELPEKVESEDILRIIRPCAQWEKQL